MTDILYKRLCKKFPPINAYERITIYAAYERIYLDLIAREFVNSKEFNSVDKINNLALKIFDVNFRWGKTYYSEYEQWPTIIFNPKILPKKEGERDKIFLYQQNYSDHYLEIKLPYNYPHIVLSTGNRGRAKLVSRQRDKYYSFITGVYDLFLENALKN